MINNPSQEISDSSTPVSRAIWAALQTQTSSSAKNFITKMVKEETAEALAVGVDIGEFSVGGCSEAEEGTASGDQQRKDHWAAGGQ